MSSYLRSSRSVFSFLRQYKPAQLPLTRCYQRTTAPLIPVASPPTHLARGWLKKSCKVVAAAFLTYSTVSHLPDAIVLAGGYALSNKETVPYTNRVHRVILSPSDEKKRSHITRDWITKKHGDNILGPSDPNTVRVRRITNDIIYGIHRVLLTKTPCGDDDDNNGDLDLVSSGSWNKQRKMAAMLPQTEHLRDLNWEVFVVRDKYDSAYSKCAGKIVIFTGLLNFLKTDAKIATFLAHEIGHVVARHCVEFHTLAESLIPFLSKLLPFSRRVEIEADHIGIMLLAAAGYDPRVAPRVFQRRGEAREESAWKDYTGTHPTYKTRSRLLSQDKVMEEALELYHSQVCAREGSS